MYIVSGSRCIYKCTCICIYLVKMSNSKTEMWSLTVRSMVDFRAMASREEWMGCTSLRVCRNSLQGTMAL